MRRVIRRRIRHTKDGVDLAVDFNADVSVNVGPQRPATAAEPGVTEDAATEDPDRPQANDDEGKDA
ncbi:MAG: hypothetical protein ACRDK0_08285 [Solirubrobacteraceae bacterium]